MDFIFGLPRDAQGRTGILVFVDRFSKMVHLAPVAAEVTADESAELFLDLVSDTTGHALHGVAYEELAAVDAAMPAASTVANFAPKPTPTPIDLATVSELLLHRQAVTRFVRDALQAAADQQKANADRRDRKNMMSFRRGDRVLLSRDGIQGSAVTNLGANTLASRFIGPFKILKVIGDAYTLDIPTSMRLHPTFYAGLLKPYVPATIPAPEAERPRPARNPSRPAADANAESARALSPHASALPSMARRTRAAPSDETASASRAAPAPTESQPSSQPQYARAQAQRVAETAKTAETETLQSRSSDATPRSNETTFRRDGPPPLVDSSGARRWIAERIVDHETRRTRTTGTVPTSRRARTTEMYYRIRWLGFPSAEDTWQYRERLMEDIPDVVKEYKATLALVFDDSGSEDDHELVSAIAHEYWRGETPGNDDIIATSISDEAPANSRDPNSRDVTSRGASSRDHSDEDHATRGVDMDISAAASYAQACAERLQVEAKRARSEEQTRKWVELSERLKSGFEKGDAVWLYIPRRPTEALDLDDDDDFDAALLPEDSWDPDNSNGGFEVGKIIDLRWVKRTRTSRRIREYLIKWKGYHDPEWVPVHQLNCGAPLYEFSQSAKTKARFQAMQAGDDHPRL
ncbi:unnamed protein product [Phytophthora fragariaefolia]|uniref:Unnamed protein product n=1 Tax=Phytophthora fragariaefolia TaxID=1490495 RepID=A0A9W7CPS5_9STRA|nr:unnamed protein product [Phytophthora fragariaefolia]